MFKLFQGDKEVQKHHWRQQMWVMPERCHLESLCEIESEAESSDSQNPYFQNWIFLSLQLTKYSSQLCQKIRNLSMWMKLRKIIFLENILEFYTKH